MPIRPENKDRYPADWKEIRAQILARAKNCCECRGECGYDHDEEWRQHLRGSGVDIDEDDDRCYAVNHEPHFVTGSQVVLTIAHLDHTPENSDEDNLRAMCQRCHLAYDRDHHRQTRARLSREAAKNLELFEETGD